MVLEDWIFFPPVYHWLVDNPVSMPSLPGAQSSIGFRIFSSDIFPITRPAPLDQWFLAKSATKICFILKHLRSLQSMG